MTLILVNLLFKSVIFSVLAMLLLFLRKRFHERFHVKWQLRMWLLVLGMLLFPTLKVGSNKLMISLPVVPDHIVQEEAKFDRQDSLNEEVPTIQVGGIEENAPYRVKLSWSLILIVIWTIGTTVLIGYNLYRHQKFVQFCDRWAVEIREEWYLQTLQTVKEKLGIKNAVGIYQCPMITTPMFIGLRSPKILLPEGFFNEGNYKYIVTHELTHYKKKHLWLRYILMISQAVYWFNPVVVLVAREISLLCELTCDNAVMTYCEDANPEQYAITMLRTIQRKNQRNTQLCTSFIGKKEDVKQRITNIFTVEKKQSGILLCVVVCMIITCSHFFVVTARTSAATTPEIPPEVQNETSTPDEFYQFVITVQSPEELYEYIRRKGHTMKPEEMQMAIMSLVGYYGDAEKVDYTFLSSYTEGMDDEMKNFVRLMQQQQNNPAVVCGEVTISADELQTRCQALIQHFSLYQSGVTTKIIYEQYLKLMEEVQP